MLQHLTFEQIEIDLFFVACGLSHINLSPFTFQWNAVHKRISAKANFIFRWTSKFATWAVHFQWQIKYSDRCIFTFLIYLIEAKSHTSCSMIQCDIISTINILIKVMYISKMIFISQINWTKRFSFFRLKMV